MNDNYIGKRIEQYYQWGNSDNFKSPTIEVEAIMSDISNDLGRYLKSAAPKQGYVEKQQKIISRLYDVTESLKELEPLDVWVRINERIRQSTAVKGGDYIKLLLPLKHEIRKYDLENPPQPTQILIDFVWNGELTEQEYRFI